MANYRWQISERMVRLGRMFAVGILPPLLGCVSTPSEPKVEHIKISEYTSEPETTANSIYMFTADWCEPCKIAKPIVEREASLRGDRIVIIDTNDFRIMDKLGYKSLPVFRMTKLGPPIQELMVLGWDETAFLNRYRSF